MSQSSDEAIRQQVEDGPEEHTAPRNEFNAMPEVKYRARVELYPVDDPDTVILKDDVVVSEDDWQLDRTSAIEEAAARFARHSRGAISNYEANNQ